MDMPNLLGHYALSANIAEGLEVFTVDHYGLLSAFRLEMKNSAPLLCGGWRSYLMMLILGSVLRNNSWKCSGDH